MIHTRVTRSRRQSASIDRVSRERGEKASSNRSSFHQELALDSRANSERFINLRSNWDLAENVDKTFGRLCARKVEGVDSSRSIRRGVRVSIFPQECL